MNKTGWLVNDCLTCIPNTKTFWHDLLEWFPNLKDMCGGYTDFGILPYTIEQEFIKQRPDYIIRNGSYFRKMNVDVKTISLMQDILEYKQQQVEVCNNSSVVVFNSSFTESQYKQFIRVPSKIIPLGTDSDLFKPNKNTIELLPDSILYIGSSAVYPKGFDKIINLIESTNYNFCLVMKDDFTISHPRVKVFNRITQDKLVDIINGCKMVVCSSIHETQHLASIESLFCNKPIVTTNVGIYYHHLEAPLEYQPYGIVCENLLHGTEALLGNYNNFKPREWAFKNGLDRESCKLAWRDLICGI